MGGKAAPSIFNSLSTAYSAARTLMNINVPALGALNALVVQPALPVAHALNLPNIPDPLQVLNIQVLKDGIANAVQGGGKAGARRVADILNYLNGAFQGQYNPQVALYTQNLNQAAQLHIQPLDQAIQVQTLALGNVQNQINGHILAYNNGLPMQKIARQKTAKTTASSLRGAAGRFGLALAESLILEPLAAEGLAQYGLVTEECKHFGASSLMATVHAGVWEVPYAALTGFKTGFTAGWRSMNYRGGILRTPLTGLYKIGAGVVAGTATAAVTTTLSALKSGLSLGWSAGMYYLFKPEEFSTCVARVPGKVERAVDRTFFYATDYATEGLNQVSPYTQPALIPISISINA